MLRINQIKIPVQEHEEIALEKKLRKLLRTDCPYRYRIIRKSLDARDKGNLLHIYVVDVEFERIQDIPHKIIDNKNIMLTKNKKYTFPHQFRDGLDKNADASVYRPIIIGAGPAGYFAALQLARAGYSPIVYERGKCVEERTKDVEGFWQGETPICANSNVSFGEGGAGTFSDGKLNTGIKDKDGRIQAVIQDFIQFGAPEEIGYLNKPHIGTDVLKQVMQTMRKEICSLGGEIYFSHQLTAITHTSDTRLALTILDLEKNQTKVVETMACILAIGHSARDTFAMLQAAGVAMEAKSFAMGLRIEHSQAMVNASQYGTSEQAKLLPAADYKMTYRSSKGRSVYSFCMCPGGFVVNASSGEGQSVVNGMSNHGRDEKNANSAIVVNVTPEDFDADGFAEYGVLAGVEFQKKYERLAYEAGNGKIPVQRFEDYKENRVSTEFGSVKPNIRGSYQFANLNNCLPAYINDAIIEGILDYDRKLKGFSSGDAVLSGIESRTSSPVRIIRDAAYCSGYTGLFPCGEGAGYAGGITSAAVDGIKVAEAVADYINSKTV